MTARSIDARRFWDRIPIRRPLRSWIQLRDAASAIRRGGAELLLSLAVLIGWTLLTLGVGALAGDRARVVYLLSTGLFLLSLAGWKLLYRLAADGLYVLTRKKTRG